MTKHKLENSEVILSNVHDRSRCAGENCTIHNMSDHHMRSWPQHWRSDRGIMERICPHGVGHPDPDSPWPGGHINWIHGCDGCCFPPDPECLFVQVGTVRLNKEGELYSDQLTLFRCLVCFALTMDPECHSDFHKKAQHGLGN